MKALLFESPNRMEVKEVPTPTVPQDGLLVKVAACLICGTDIRIFRGKKTKDVRIPAILGHEFSGIITEIGAKVGGFQIGEAVSIAPVVPCLTCYNCKHGQENVCLNRTAFGYEYDGAFSEFVKIPAAAIKSGNVYPAPQGVDIQGIALAEPLACCINGHGNSPVHLGDTVVVMGAGPIGLMHLLLAKQSGAKVIVSEPSEHRRNTALSLGADVAVDPASQSLKDIVLEHTHSVGADVVFMAIGVPALVNQAIDLSRKRGWVNLFAGFSVGDMPPIDVNKIHYKEVKLTGTSASSRKDHEVALKLIANRVIDPSKIITHQYPLSQAVEAFRTAETGLGIKVAVIP
ncbi:MAG: zinc-dependent dehydrogenase [Thermodesulfobacteriota bacterium]